MELFSVNRYNGETTEAGDKSEKILNKLLKKAEKRKRKLEQESLLITDKPKKAKRDAEQPYVVNKTIEELVENDTENDNDTPIAKETLEDVNDVENFKVLGEDVASLKAPKVEMVLPPWLAYPTIISTDIALSEKTGETAKDTIASLDYLTSKTRKALKELSVTHLFPVQETVIPWVLEAHKRPMPFRPRDICVSAPTGSGKTLAYAIPIVQLLSNRVRPQIRALVVLPVGELALQVFKVLNKLCSKTDLNVILLSKQVPFAKEQERLVDNYRGQTYSKVDIVVTTPGRLVEHLHTTKGFCLKNLKFLVIDEADRIMDALFQNWLYHLDTHVKDTADQLLAGGFTPLCYEELLISATTQPHKMLFSATLSQDPEKLQGMRLFHPKLFTSIAVDLNELRDKFERQAIEGGVDKKEARGDFIGKYTKPKELTEKYCLIENRVKPLTLFALIQENGWEKFLCFTNSTDAAERLAYVLQKLAIANNLGLVIQELSAALNVKQRIRVLGKFSAGKINGLICSDALARGIDIPAVDIVISYDRPRHVTTYIHRIGRTARAGNKGTAITLLTKPEYQEFNKTLLEVGMSLTEKIAVTSDAEEKNVQKYMQALNSLRSVIENKKRLKAFIREQEKTNKLPNKDPSQMTTMEQLQMELNERAQERFENEDKKLIEQEMRIPRKFRKPENKKKNKKNAQKQQEDK